MRTPSINKLLFRFSLFFALALTLMAHNTTQAADYRVIVEIAFDRPAVVIGKSFLLYISIANTIFEHPVKVTRFECFTDGTSVRGATINHKPSTLAVNQIFQTQQMYRAVAPGLTTIYCELTGYDTLTGVAVSGYSQSLGMNVIDEKRLYFDVTSPSNVAKVGQITFLQVKFGNRGKTPFSIHSIECTRLGRGEPLVFISKTPLPTVILPGQSAYMEYRWQPLSRGLVSISCTLNAVDSTTGNYVILPAPYLSITVR
jgi:hypothetical protein